MFRCKKLTLRASWVGMLGVVCCLVLLAGCSTSGYRAAADKEAYGAIQSRTQEVPNMDGRFNIEQTNQVNLEGFPLLEKPEPALGPEGSVEVGAHVLSLEQALLLAIRHNRAYQLQKEQLYLTALGLTLARHQWTPMFSAGGQAKVAGQTEKTLEFAYDPDTGRTNLVVSDNLVEQRSASGGASVGATWLIRDLGRVTAAFSTDFFRYLAGDPRAVTSSRVAATFVRPLLRNAGFKQQLEALTQAERDLLYDLREFTLFRKRFSVQVATAYYAVLGRKDAVRNSFLNLESSRRNAERTRALALEGRVTQADLGRLEQQQLDAEGAWIAAVRGYRQSLDDFKFAQLGLPVETPLVLEDRELEALTIRHPTITVDESIQVALTGRLDYQNSRDRREDAARRVKLAADGLKAGVDVLADVGFNSAQGDSTGIAVPDPARYRWSAGLDVDLPLDRKAERNVYRRAIIQERQAERALDQQADEIRLEVRESWRTLDQAKRNHEISEIGVRLAERRVEEQNLLAELGRAKAQDQVDAQNALNASKNARTQALVTHTIARLQFWNNMGILYIKDSGQWEEINEGNTR